MKSALLAICLAAASTPAVAATAKAPPSRAQLQAAVRADHVRAAQLTSRIALDRKLEHAYWTSDSLAPLRLAWHDRLVAQRQLARVERDERRAAKRLAVAPRPAHRG